MNNVILDVAHVSKSYSTGTATVEVLKDVNFQLRAGEWLTLLGSSGSGKTTLLNLLGLLEKPDSGTIRINAAESIDCTRLNGKAAARFRNRYLGFVFQSYCLLPELTAQENVMLPGMMAGLPNISKKAAELLDRVGLSHRLKHRPTELSGGEQQRVSIARALINDPEILLADEPTGNLDSRTGDEILKLFTELRTASPERAIVMITHNEAITGLADRVLTLKDGVLL